MADVENKNVLITGCAGLFGANFSRYLLRKDYFVVGIDDLSGGYEEYLPTNKNFVFYKGKITDFNLDEIMKKHRIDYVFHFAAYAAAGLSPFIREFNYQNNIIESAALINASIRNKVKRFIFTSSMEVYGEQQTPFIETQTPKPETPYGIAKFAVEMDLDSAYHYHGLEYRIIRPHNVHGLYQNIWDRYRNVIGIFIRQALKNENLTVFGSGQNIRAFSDIKFYMEPLEKLMFHEKKYDHKSDYTQYCWNIGTDKPTTVLELANIVKDTHKKFSNKNIAICHLEERKEVPIAFCNHSKAKEELGFEDKTNLVELVENMYSWANNQSEKEIKTIQYEIEKNIYDYWK